MKSQKTEDRLAKANELHPIVVFLILGLFIGCFIGYIAYTVVSSKLEREAQYEIQSSKKPIPTHPKTQKPISYTSSCGTSSLGGSHCHQPTSKPVNRP